MIKMKKKKTVVKNPCFYSILPWSGVCSHLPCLTFPGGIEIFLSLIFFFCFLLCSFLLSQKLLSTHLLNIQKTVLLDAFSGGVYIPVEDWVWDGGEKV